MAVEMSESLMLVLPHITHSATRLRHLLATMSRRRPLVIVSVTPSLSLELVMAGQGLGFFWGDGCRGRRGRREGFGFLGSGWGRVNEMKCPPLFFLYFVIVISNICLILNQNK